MYPLSVTTKTEGRRCKLQPKEKECYPIQVATYKEIMKQPKVKMLVGLDKKCICRNNIIAKKCCITEWSCNCYKIARKIATKEFVRMLSKCLGTQTKNLIPLIMYEENLDSTTCKYCVNQIF